MGRITAATKLAALLGHPVGHSLSPLLQNAAMQALNVPAVYLAFDVAPPDLPAAVGGLRAVGMLGANVTLPHKQSVMCLLDDLHPQAARIGSVNTIVNLQGHLTGHNTDAAGFLSALRSGWGGQPAETTALVLGAGGAARAVAAALVELSVRKLLIWNRTQQKAADLAEACRGWGHRQCHAVPRPGLRAAAAKADLIINATSAGVAEAGIKEMEEGDDIFREGQFVMDLRYGSNTLVGIARQCGAQAMDGWEMLVQQAALSFTLWSGLEAPVGEMRAAARSAA